MARKRKRKRGAARDKILTSIANKGLPEMDVEMALEKKKKRRRRRRKKPKMDAAEAVKGKGLLNKKTDDALADLLKEK